MDFFSSFRSLIPNAIVQEAGKHIFLPEWYQNNEQVFGSWGKQKLKAVQNYRVTVTWKNPKHKRPGLDEFSIKNLTLQ